jgi:hypothetical protein
MSALKADDAIDYRRLHELYEDFMRHWNRLHAFYLDASVGFSYVLAHVESEQMRARSFVQGSELDSQEFQDTRQFSYDDIFSDSFCASAIHAATQGEVRTRNAPGGENFTTLGQLCLISFYDFWEDYLRREYAIAKGFLDRNERDPEIEQKCLRDHASHDLWGDLRHLRTSIVHNLGIATSDISKCKLIKWFKPGDPIVLPPGTHASDLSRTAPIWDRTVSRTPSSGVHSVIEARPACRSRLYSTRFRGCHRAPPIPEELGCRVSAFGDDPVCQRFMCLGEAYPRLR